MESFNKFVSNYIGRLSFSILNSNLKNLNLSVKEILKTIKKNVKFFVCGNGGSADIANHYVVDFLKYFRQHTKYKPKIYSLSNNIETITAVSNDIDYDEVFKFQAESYCEKKDLIIIVSSSGNSSNIKKLVKFAKKNKITTIGFSGFKGGFLKKNSDISIHIDVNNYGISEDSHHILMHIQLQYLISFLKKKNKKIY